LLPNQLHLLSLKYLSAFSLTPTLDPPLPQAFTPKSKTGRQDVNAIVGGATSFPAPYHHARPVGFLVSVFLFRVKAKRMMRWVPRSGSFSLPFLVVSLRLRFALVLLLGLSSSLHRVIVVMVWCVSGGWVCCGVWLLVAAVVMLVVDTVGCLMEVILSCGDGTVGCVGGDEELW
jgi:hypothetical protein